MFGSIRFARGPGPRGPGRPGPRPPPPPSRALLPLGGGARQTELSQTCIILGPIRGGAPGPGPLGTPGSLGPRGRPRSPGRLAPHGAGGGREQPTNRVEPNMCHAWANPEGAPRAVGDPGVSGAPWAHRAPALPDSPGPLVPPWGIMGQWAGAKEVSDPRLPRLPGPLPPSVYRASSKAFSVAILAQVAVQAACWAPGPGPIRGRGPGPSGTWAPGPGPRSNRFRQPSPGPGARGQAPEGPQNGQKLWPNCGPQNGQSFWPFWGPSGALRGPLWEPAWGPLGALRSPGGPPARGLGKGGGAGHPGEASRRHEARAPGGGHPGGAPGTRGEA